MVHCLLRSTIAISAGMPTAKLPPLILNIRAGLVDIFWTTSLSDNIPGWTSFVRITPSAFSNPTKPEAPFLRSSWVCGAWSVAMTSITPLDRPFCSASRSFYRTQWRVGFWRCSIGVFAGLVQQQMVRRHFTGDVCDVPPFGLLNDVNRTLQTNV